MVCYRQRFCVRCGKYNNKEIRIAKKSQFFRKININEGCLKSSKLSGIFAKFQ